jgi:hypothetical protein
VWGDNDCSGLVSPVDSLALLRWDAGLPVNKTHPDCPDIGVPISPSARVPQGLTLTWGNIDCIGDPGPVDSLKLLRHDGGLPIDQVPGCPSVGEPLNGDPAPSFKEIAEHWAPVIYQDSAVVPTAPLRKTGAEVVAAGRVLGPSGSPPPWFRPLPSRRHEQGWSLLGGR